jgi:CRISPR-associated exonuclease Cas4
LCAQALCLEEMLDCAVPEGALFYGKTRRRKAVIFDAALRHLTREVILAVRTVFNERRTPKATYEAKRCDPCSLIELCRPRELEQRQTVHSWLLHHIEEG